MHKTPKENDAILTEEGKRLPGYVLAALGVVFGDIGTSPLYAFRECFLGTHAPELDTANVLGVLSLVIWALLLVISLKYLVFVLRADNRGEGGILALMALVVRGEKEDSRRQSVLILLGLFGAALLYGDSMITPAISVLSAVEGLRDATPVFDPYVVPIAIGVLLGLFFYQHHGTARIGKVFGPVVLVWFGVLALIGIRSIVQEPGVLRAFDPIYALRFFSLNGWRGFAVLGTVFLVVTGGEALYADMGHLGRRPIRIGWFVLVLPALLLNYLGQGALLIRSSESLPNLFFAMFPSWALYPMVLLATVATVIASQAVLSGAFSLTQQAVQLGYLPRMTIVHTSEDEFGQVYVPLTNWALFAGAVGLVLAFRASGGLAHAYGVAVTTTMLITTILMYFATRKLWKWSVPPAALMACGFLVVDVSFFGANIVKVLSGGWIPLLIAGIVYVCLVTWKTGRSVLVKRVRQHSMSVKAFIDDVKQTKPTRIPGLAVFLTGHASGVPVTLLHNYKHNKVLHKQLILVTVQTVEQPRVPKNERADLEDLGCGLFRATFRFGFSEQPNVPAALRGIDPKVIDFKVADTTFFLGRETLLVDRRQKSKMWHWQRRLFAFASRTSPDATRFFGIPPNRTIEIGVQIPL